MSLVEGQRVRVVEATGDRKRFRGRSGEIVWVQKRWRDHLEPFVHVRLEGSERSRVFWPHEIGSA